MTARSDPQAKADAGRIARLVDDLHRTYAELRTLVGPETDAVLHLPSAIVYTFPETQRDLSRMESVQRGYATERAAILDAMPAQVAILDESGTIMAVNQSWRTFGRENGGPETDATVGMNYVSLCQAAEGPDQSEAMQASDGLDRVMSGGSDLFVQQYRCDTPTFSRWYQMTVTPLGSGRRRGAVVMHVDVSEPHRADEREADLHGRIEQLVDQAPIGILVHRNFVPILANKELVRMFGYALPEDILALADCRSLFEQPDHDLLASYAAARVAGESAPAQFQLTGRHVDGRKITLEMRAFPISWGKEIVVCAMMTDITAQLQVEEQLRTSQRLEALGHLTGGIAHDFNNLLTVILGNADLLIETLDDPVLRANAVMTAKAAERGAALTARLLAFARMQPLEPQVIDINQRIDAMDDLLHRALGGQIKVDVVKSASLWPALVDPGELESAILNLCINARDAMPGGGLLTIETANVQLDQSDESEGADGAAGPYVMIAVSDKGTGMDADTVKRVFDPFFTTKAVGLGSGMGLSRVYGFVKQSNGRILIYSEPGHGTSFKLYFPRAAGGMPAAADEDGDPGIVNHRDAQERILLVEDDESVRQLVTDQLITLGYDVVAMESAAAALDALRTDTGFDLLFTDVIMRGGMNGRELADEIATFLPDLPVLFTSGYSGNAIIRHGHLDPGVLLLQKPYRRQELARMLQVALRAEPADPR